MPAQEKIGSWADGECFYVSAVDGPKFALILGPFRTEAPCRKYAYLDPESGGDPDKHLRVMHIANQLDPKSAFYGFGMVKMPNGYRTGVLNKQLDLTASEFFGTDMVDAQCPECGSADINPADDEGSWASCNECGFVQYDAATLALQAEVRTEQAACKQALGYIPTYREAVEKGLAR